MGVDDNSVKGIRLFFIGYVAFHRNVEILHTYGLGLGTVKARRCLGRSKIDNGTEAEIFQFVDTLNRPTGCRQQIGYGPARLGNGNSVPHSSRKLHGFENEGFHHRTAKGIDFYGVVAIGSFAVTPPAAGGSL